MRRLIFLMAVTAIMFMASNGWSGENISGGSFLKEKRFPDYNSTVDKITPHIYFQNR